MSLKEGIERLVEDAQQGENISETGDGDDGNMKHTVPDSAQRFVVGLNADVPNSTNNAAFVLVEIIRDAYETGLPVELRYLFAGESRRRITLPTYAFARQPYWFND